ncbi:F-box domain containing protein [Quillaja saponaria]|uniref:F-box domain containing protein n=1 Tax=Quillaja saponaria TaxID=32244 RepID=A0AAD7LGV0_QUISA|nr:F-box domain containing protein [Quillaja saponaria]
MSQLAGIQELGGKEEIYFDSQVWLDSDNEDFYSVNDTIQSQGNTPIHPSSFAQTRSDVKKQLIELFRESYSDDLVGGIQNLQGSSEAKPTRGSKRGKGKLAESAQCCLPNFVRRKKKWSPP